MIETAQSHAGLNLKALSLQREPTPENKDPLLRRMQDYRPVFLKEASFRHDEIRVISANTNAKKYWDSETQKQIAGNGNGPSRIRAHLIVSLERRLGKPLSDPELAQLNSTHNAIYSIASSLKFTNSDPNVNMAAVVECCLDEIGVEEKVDESALPAEVARLDDLTHMVPDRINPRKNPAAVAQMKKHMEHPWWGHGGWDEEMEVISRNSHSIRELIKSRSRVKSAMIHLFENTKDFGPFIPQDLAKVRNLSGYIATLAREYGLKTGDPAANFSWFVSEAVRMMDDKQNTPVDPYWTDRLALKAGASSGSISIGSEHLRFVKRQTTKGPQLFLVNVTPKNFDHDRRSGKSKFAYQILLVPGKKYVIGQGDESSTFPKMPYFLRIDDGDKFIQFSRFYTGKNSGTYDWWTHINDDQCTLTVHHDGSFSLSNNSGEERIIDWNRSDFDRLRVPPAYLKYHKRPPPEKLLQAGRQADYNSVNKEFELRNNPYAYANNKVLEWEPTIVWGKNWLEYVKTYLEEYSDPKTGLPRPSFVIIAEGKGTPEHASTASHDATRKAVETLRETYGQYRKDGFSHNNARSIALKSVMIKANEELFDRRDVCRDDHPLPQASTAAAFLEDNGDFAVARFGSSPKVFRISDQKMDEVVAPNSKTAGRFLGEQPEISDFDVIEGKLAPGEQLLICTEEIWRNIETDILHYYARTGRHVKDAMDNIVALAQQKGHKDIAIAILEQKKTA